MYAVNELNSISNLSIEAVIKSKRETAIRQGKSLVVSVVGAGGKTSLIYHLANQLKSEFRILVTTTTMMFKPDVGLDHTIYQQGLQERALLEKLMLLAPLTTSNQVTGLFLNEVGAGLDIDGSQVIKLKGVDQTLVDQIAKANLYDLILIEADGSRRRPLKAYGTHEPVLPQCSDLVIVVMGLRGLNQPVSEETVHRLDQFSALTGKKAGDALHFEDLLTLFSGEESFLKSVPEGCEVVALFNQADCLTQTYDFLDLSQKLFRMNSKIKHFLVVSLDKKWTYAAYLGKSDGDQG
ncbi:selenium cofactor biosynthesis protein YqeC [Fusibacter ferrireducens]|uniref:Selenium-dependent hydroxylase accessory protein YqeC n=1 Tax=Fusibacter ferrireducens TaxID=2785058 RepID=A0ABR9ZSX2_9FIRM|nr:selenium cofactor biosynthesis protein YqeC [Fusibacter ferrireducens]MBF4693542.1 putative selenium-dependent hydroxylase accessory protein YqeC [Fusibacter ferrireducens]